MAYSKGVRDGAGCQCEKDFKWDNSSSLCLPKVGLSNGAKLGIGLGVGLGVPAAILLLTGLIFCFKRASVPKMATGPTFAAPSSSNAVLSPYPIGSRIPTEGGLTGSSIYNPNVFTSNVSNPVVGNQPPLSDYRVSNVFDPTPAQIPPAQVPSVAPQIKGPIPTTI